MTKDNPPAIDPRYDPAFQRGFAGSAHARIRAVDSPREQPRPEPRAQPRQSVQRPAAEEPGDPFVVPPARPPVADPLDAVDAAPGDSPARPSGLKLRGNPWVAGLWVVGVLLVTAGFLGTWRSQSIYVGATPVDDMSEIVTMEVLDLLSPPLLLVGLLVLAGVLFLHAIAWRSRRGDEDNDD
jgi:hypothetical protein